MKRVISVVASLALAFSALVSVGISPAAAVTPTSNLFSLNIADQNANSHPRNYFNYNGKLYFTADSLSHGEAIWSVTSATDHDPQLVADVYNGTITGNYFDFLVVGNYAFFQTQNTTHFNGYEYWVLDLDTNAVAPIQTAASEQITGGYDGYNFVKQGSKMYVLGHLPNDGYGATPHLFSYNTADRHVTDLQELPFSPVDTYSAPMAASGNFLYSTKVASNWNVHDNQVMAYDIAGGTWASTGLGAGGTTFNNSFVQGEYSYNGVSGVIVRNSTGVYSGSWPKDWAQYFVAPDGSVTRMGTWTNYDYQVGFVNFSGNLYEYGTAQPEGSTQFAQVDNSTGQETNLTSTMFPGATTIYVSSATVIGNKLWVAAWLNTTNSILLYNWSGTGAAQLVSTVPVITGKNSYADFYTNDGYSNNYEIGAIGNTAVTGLTRDDTIGNEPYFIAQDNTVALVKNIMTGSAGSDPDTSCFINTPGGDWMTSKLPQQVSSGWGKSVIVQMKPNGSYLDYSVIDPGTAENPCGFNYIGDKIYFNGYDTVSQNDSLYSIDSSNVVTNVGSVSNTSYMAVSFGGNYYYLNRGRWGSDLYEYDIASNTDIRLTGDSGSPLSYDSIDDKIVLLGNVLYMTVNNHLWAADLTQSTFTPVQIDSEISSQGDTWYPSDLQAFDGKLIFDTQQNQNDGPAVFSVDPSNNAITKLYDTPTGEESWSNGMFTIGSKVYMNVGNNNNESALWKWSTGATANKLPLPSGFQLNCVAPTGTDIAISDQNGDTYFYGNGSTTLHHLDYSFAGNTGALCDASRSINGTYLQVPEYPYDYGTLGTEPGYIGALTPRAISRLGQTVNEPPAQPLSSAIPTDNPPAAPGAPGTPIASPSAGKVNLTWTAPTTGGEVGNYVVESIPAGAVCQISGTSAECIGLDVGTSYTFKVTATNAGGIAISSLSNAAAPLAALDAPANPAKPTVTAGDTAAVVTWAAPTTGGAVSTYVVTPTPNDGHCTVAGLTARCTGLSNGTSYSFVVTAVNDTDTAFSVASDSATPDSGLTLPTAPGAPGKPTVTSSNGSASLSWSAPTTGDPVSSYTVTSEPAGANCVVTGTTAQCTGLTNGTAYTFKVAATNAGGGAESAVSDAVTPSAGGSSTPAPGAPGKPNVTVSSGSASLTWSAPTSGGAVTSYTVTSNPAGALCIVTGTHASCVGLTNGTAYTFTVTAVNDGGTTSSVVSNSVTPKAAQASQGAKPIRITGFGSNAWRLNNKVINGIIMTLTNPKTIKSVTCTGTTQNKWVTRAGVALAKARATMTCLWIKHKYPKIKTTTAARAATGVAPANRSVLLSISRK